MSKCVPPSLVPLRRRAHGTVRCFPRNAAYINKRIPSQLANKTGSVFLTHTTRQTRAGWLAG